MIYNFNTVFKIFLTLIFLSLSLVFFYFGYNELDIVKIINTVEVNKEKIKDSNQAINKIDSFQQIDIPQVKEIKEIIENELIITVKKNDTFSKLIDPYCKNNKIKQNIINSINKIFNLKKLNIDQKIFLYFIDFNDNNYISKIIIPLDYSTDLVVIKNNDKYIGHKVKLPIKTSKVSAKYTISKSLFEDGRANDIPLSILSEVIRLYSFDIDFQRDIHKGNKLEIMYDIFFNENRRTISYGEIEYANLIQDKSNTEYFLFKSSDEFADYFDRGGKNVRKTLMKTPLDGAKLSSNYGMRKHPILGYNKMHKGVDFAAPKGTPVYAAGNGVVDYAGRNGAYGKYIRIRHNNSYKTAYAHLNSYNKGISKGTRVKQGQIIGYVGTTGRSSGPHLHYEVIYKGKQINPMKMKLPSGKTLKGKELENFLQSSNIIYSNFLFHLFE